jgi:hypothetical protein
MWNNEDSHAQLLDSKYIQQSQDMAKRNYMQKDPAIHPAYTKMQQTIRSAVTFPVLFRGTFNLPKAKILPPFLLHLFTHLRSRYPRRFPCTKSTG